MPGLLRFGVRKNWEPCAIRYTESGLQPWILPLRVEREMHIGQLRNGSTGSCGFGIGCSFISREQPMHMKRTAKFVLLLDSESTAIRHSATELAVELRNNTSQLTLCYRRRGKAEKKNRCRTCFWNSARKLTSLLADAECVRR